VLEFLVTSDIEDNSLQAQLTGTGERGEGREKKGVEERVEDHLADVLSWM
jgi:hypothetical protein